MRVLIVGGGGFIGQALVARLRLNGHLDGQRCSRVTVLDQHISGQIDDPLLRYVEADIGVRSVLEQCIADGADCVFHLASVTGGAAERDFELGMKVNLHSMLGLLEALRAAGSRPKLVFASSIAVYGVPLPQLVDEQTLPLPTLSYGVQKLIGEQLVADYSRRGFIDGCSLRIPGIVARPPSAGMLSGFLSDLIRELSAGREFVCPVAASGQSWLMSRSGIIDNLLHAASLSDAQRAERRTWLLPVLHLSMSALVQAIARQHGAQVLQRVSYRPQSELQAQFANYPPLHCPASLAAGFRHDGDAERLIARALEPI
ncbi:MAG TPA: NAD-dependent epimerase/dehydratase family protein [Steroidobacteraceae bacterium]|jgi:nucleoside-diphosphate-sugar epimerase